jgi:uncharacterized Zn-finger protein
MYDTVLLLFQNHVNRHLKDYPYKCELCGMTFQKLDSLTTHMRIHTGEKPYVCEICEKAFSSEKNKRGIYTITCLVSMAKVLLGLRGLKAVQFCSFM